MGCVGVKFEQSVCVELKLPYCNLTNIQIQPIRYENSLFALTILKRLPTDESDNVRGKLTELKFSKHIFSNLSDKQYRCIDLVNLYASSIRPMHHL